MKEIKLNKVKINPILTNEISYDRKNLKSFDMVPLLYYNMFLCSKKKSGKTSVIGNLLEKTCGRKTTVFLFCATYQVDSTWKAIIKKLRKKNINVVCFDTLKEGRVNHLDILIDELSVAVDEDEEIPKKDEKRVPQRVDIFNNRPKLYFGEGEDEDEEVITKEVEENHFIEKRKQKKTVKKKSPPYIFVMDDLSTEIRNPAIARLLKVHRHLKSSVIISSQYLHDLKPASILQLDIFLTFKGMSEDKMEKIHRLLDISMSFEDFFQAYHYCTKEKYNFFYLNCRTEEMRRNFNRLITLE